MQDQSIADVATGQEEREVAQQMLQVFSYLEQNPQNYPQVRQQLIEQDILDPEDLPEQLTPQQLSLVRQGFAEAAGAAPPGGLGSELAKMQASATQAPTAAQPVGLGGELAKMGRNGDTMIAHITPQEAQLLQGLGGAGTINPATGMPEFFNLKKKLKRIAKPLTGAILGAVAGFFTAGPVGAVVGGVTGAAAGEQSYQASKATKEARQTAQEEQALAREFENNRIAEAQAEAERLRQAEERRQANILAGQQEISSAFGQFDDNFYNQRAQSYLDFANPQLERQYQDQQRSLVAALTRSGNLNSSTRAELMAKLQREYDEGKLQLANSARTFADQARASTEAARARLTESNASLADPGAVRTAAAAEAAGLTVNPNYQNLGSLLSNLSGSVTSGGQRPAGASGGGVSLYGGRSGSGRLVA
jgi:hypothetical protein